MPIELKITAENVEEFDGLLARFHPGAAPARASQEWGDKVVVTDVAEVTLPLEPAPRGSTAAEAETPLDPPATKTRAKKPLAGAGAAEPAHTENNGPAESGTSASSVTTSPSDDEHPMLVSKTLADVKALGNKLVSALGAGPVQALLLEQFKVKAFGALDPADFDAAYAALEALK